MSHAIPTDPRTSDESSPKLIARRPVRNRICGTLSIARPIKIQPKAFEIRRAVLKTKR